MGNNPILYNDPDGDFIAQAVGGVVGAGVNVFSNLDKIIANPWSAVGYAASGAVGGAVATINPALGKSSQLLEMLPQTLLLVIFQVLIILGTQ